jgi:hypothetical protein
METQVDKILNYKEKLFGIHKRDQQPFQDRDPLEIVRHPV